MGAHGPSLADPRGRHPGGRSWRRPAGRRAPRLVLQDTAGGSLRIELDGRWHAPVPILRYVLAAAEERGVPLSEHARYEFEFHRGLTGRVRYPADEAPRT